MNSINPSLEQLILEKSKAIDIPPRLLATALNVLAENEQATEADILAHYRKLIVNDLREEALSQLYSSLKKERESAHYSLSGARTALVEMVREQSPEFNQIDAYREKDEELKNFHLEAWNLITDELLMIKNKYRKVLGQTDLTEIVREFCTEELEQWAHQVA
ncbi:hypothetical protein V9K67_07690 [Paraflavisolibacter sp. H34]|uniref:hypothetical protein n=1 Tax=Huijunlia imazamoxiresistens TaxID=3127457 RepID=UPI0030174EEB